VRSCQYLAHLLEDACPNCLYISNKLFSGAHGNFEEQSKVLEATRIIITCHIIIIIIIIIIVFVSAYNNFIMRSINIIFCNNGLLEERDMVEIVEAVVASTALCLKRRL
jgi:hypothetical protein